MSCICDEHPFPRGLDIPPGLASLPRQIGTFGEFRRAMIGEIARRDAWKTWRGRDTNDFGLMLLEMWAYVCDVATFYDQSIANEEYVRTALRRASLRKLTALIGYRPRPAVAAKVDLALVASGRQAIVVPAGTGFRSSGFGSEPPQTFELDHDARIHPLLDGWDIERVRKPLVLPSLELLVERNTCKVKRHDDLLFDIGGAISRARVVSVDPIVGGDGEKYTKLVLDGPIGMGTIAPSSMRILRAGARLDFDATDLQSARSDDDLGGDSTAVPVAKPKPNPNNKAKQAKNAAPKNAKKAANIPQEGMTAFRGTRSDLVVGLEVVTISKGDARLTSIDEVLVRERLRLFTSSTTTDGTTTETRTLVPTTYTLLTFDDRAHVPETMFHALTEVAKVTTELKRTLDPNDSIRLVGAVEEPFDKSSTTSFMLGDDEGGGVAIAGTLDFDTRTITPSAAIQQSLAAIVHAWGNIAHASRGETVPAETLGNGDPFTPSQSFTLKKSPLTYVPDASDPIGVVNTLRVRVNGVLWKEVPSFFGIAPDAQVYIVREDDDGKSTVTFGDGVRGARLPAGQDNVIATYRFGAGRASPPAGSITQIATAVTGLSSVANPVAATGGDDADAASKLRSLAPRSALVLGRAVSIEDMEALARAQPGVRAAKAEWRWDGHVQRAVVLVYYVGTALERDIVAALRAVSDPTVPITCKAATAQTLELAIDLELDPRHVASRVRSAVRDALTQPESGILSLERIGIGAPLFESAIYDAVLAVEGTVDVTGLRWEHGTFGTPLFPYGVRSNAGEYFDLEPKLLIDGKDRFDV